MHNRDYKPPGFGAIKNTIQVGDKVRLTGKHLRNIGQQRGGEGQSVWTVTAINEPWAVTNERFPDSYAKGMWTPEELEADPSLRFRRIHLGNLQRVVK